MSIFIACSWNLLFPFSCEVLLDVVDVDGSLLSLKSHSPCHLPGGLARLASLISPLLLYFHRSCCFSFIQFITSFHVFIVLIHLNSVNSTRLCKFPRARALFASLTFVFLAPCTGAWLHLKFLTEWVNISWLFHLYLFLLLSFRFCYCTVTPMR